MGNGKIDGGLPFLPPEINGTDNVESVKEETNAIPSLPTNAADSAPTPAHDNAAGKLSELSFGGLARAAQLQTLTTEEFSKYQNDVKKDPNFQQLSPRMQEEILNDMDLLFEDPKAMENLRQLATDPNFAKLSQYDQQVALNNLMRSPDSAANLKSIKSEIQDRVTLEGNPNFQKLPDSTKRQISDLLDKFPMQPDARQQLIKLGTLPELKDLSETRQGDVLQAFMKAPYDSAHRGNLETIVKGFAHGSVDDATQARVLNMAAKEAGHTKFTSDLAKLVSDTRFSLMPAAYKAKTLNVFESTTPAGRNALQSLLEQQFAVPYAGATYGILDQLDRLAAANISANVTDSTGSTAGKAQVMEDLLQELAGPSTYINQSSKGTCTCTSMSYALARNNPAEYARIATDLLTTGQSTLKNGSTVTPPADGFAFDGTQRSASERLIQSALMNFGMGGTYSNVTDTNTATGGSGLTWIQEAKVLKALNGKNFTVHTDKVLDRAKSELKQGHVPVFTSVKWGGGGHAIEITKIENGRVYFRNPWGGNTPGIQGVGPTGTVPGPGSPIRVVEDGPNAIESVSIENFEILANAVITED